MRLKSNQCGIVFAEKLTYTMIVATKIYLGGSIMGKFNLNEQIAFLRKAKNVTQEEMAQSLGVTNQSVSKWESAQCCPDIQLLPAIADYFDVSVDELIGHKDAARANNLILQARSAINELSQGEDSKLALKLVYTINAALFLKRCKWNSEDAFEHAGTAEWGSSYIASSEITACMRYGSVFFSDNNIRSLKSDKISELCGHLDNFYDIDAMKTFIALYTLNVNNKNAYVSAKKIAECANLSKDTVLKCLEGNLAEYLSVQKDKEELLCRINGEYMHIVPLLTMLCNP